MALGVIALLVALGVGLPAGVAAALKKDGALDVVLRLVATAGIALPNFVIAGFLVLLVVFLVPLFPVAGYDGLRSLVLPGIVLGLPFAAYVALRAPR